MGLLDDYGIDLDGVEAPSYDVEDGIYEFEIGDHYIKSGTDKFPDKSWIIISYLLGDAGKTKDEWFQLPEDASNPTPKELEKLGYYKARLIDLGIPEEGLNSAGPDQTVGLRGTLHVATKNGWQNVKNVKLDTDGENEFSGVKSTPDEAPAEEAAPAAKAPAARAPRQTPAARAAAAGQRPNPFAKG